MNIFSLFEYMINLIFPIILKTKYCHNQHLIQEDNCRICLLGDHRWDPRNELEKAEQYFFKWESKRVKKVLKPTEMKKFIIQDGIVYDDRRLSPEFQLKTKDLDQVGYLDKHPIVGRIPVVLPDFSVLYTYTLKLYLYRWKN